MNYFFRIDAASEVNKVVVQSSIDREVVNVGQEGKFEVSGTIEGEGGGWEQVEATVITSESKEVSQSEDIYVRKYDDFEPESDVQIGAVYIPFMHGKWDRCAVGEPRIGEYSMQEYNFDHLAVNIHIDQMQGFGITPLLFNFGEEIEDRGRFREFEEATMADDIKVEFFYVISQALRRGRDIYRDFEFMRKKIATTDNYNTHQGRPVVYFWGPQFLGWGGNPEAKRVRENILDQWGSVPSFFQNISSKLTVNGTEPYMVGDFGNLGHNYLEWGGDEDILKILPEFDAITSWTGHLPSNETVVWEDQYDFVKQDFRGLRMLAQEHGLDFAPMVFPGFDDRANDCWGENRYTPPDPKHLQDLLELANKYRTVDRINIATWNDWNEGHMIEPGSYMGEDYGNDYLEVVKSFLRNVEKDSPEMERESLRLEFGQTVPESELNPDIEDGRDLTFSLEHITVRNEQWETVLDVNVGGAEEDIFFIKGAYGREKSDENTWRWLGRTPTTILDVPTMPESGFIELTGLGAAEMRVKVIIDDKVKGERRVGTRHDTYQIDFGLLE